MLDNFGRKIDYVRISVTDRCDLRCKYCMPESNPNFYKKELKDISIEDLLGRNPIEPNLELLDKNIKLYF